MTVRFLPVVRCPRTGDEYVAGPPAIAAGSTTPHARALLDELLAVWPLAASQADLRAVLWPDKAPPVHSEIHIRQAVAALNQALRVRRQGWQVCGVLGGGFRLELVEQVAEGGEG